MDRRYADMIVRMAALIGVAVSAWMVVQYALPPEASACGPGGGCNAVRFCRFANIGGVTWPYVGLVAFGAVLVASLADTPLARRALPWAGLGAAATGLGLIVLQKLGCNAYCKFCLVADVAGVALGVGAWLGRPREPVAADAPPRVRPVERWLFGALAALSVLFSLGWGASRPDRPVEPHRVAQLPEPIAREQRAGVATIVEFADFECPFCRRQHGVLKEVLASFGPRVRFVRKHVPLRMHPNAENAARAACCAEEQGRGEPMADALFESPAEELTPQGCERIAQRLGVDLAVYRECVSAARTTDRLTRDREAATASGVEGLPTMYVGAERFDGVVPASTLRESVNRALRSSASAAATPPRT